MILLHSTVLASVLTPLPDRAITEWLDTRPVTGLCVSVVTMSKLAIATTNSKIYRDKPAVATRLDELLQNLFGERVLPFAPEHAALVAKVSGAAARLGFHLSEENAALAAVAYAENLSVATLDPAPLEAAGIKTVSLEAAFA